MSKSEHVNPETGKRHRFDVINRRTFLKLSSAFMALLAISHVFKRTVIGEADPPPASGESITTESWVPTSCLNCASRCATRVRVVNGKAVNVTGNPLSQVSEGEVCLRALAGLQVLYDPDRVKGPMKRTNPSKGKGVDPGWETISWQQAFEEVGEKLKAPRDRLQPQRLLLLYGLNSVSDEDIIRRFARAYGTPNAVPAEPYGREAVKAGNWMADGHYTLHGYDLPNTNYILAFGAGILEAEKPLSRNLRMWGKIRRDRPDRARVVVIDPRYSLTASRADRWVPITPGTDGALAMAIANVIISEGLYDSDFIDNYTAGFEEYKELVLNDYQPEEAAAITGISAETIREIASEFARTRPAIAWPGHGASCWSNGSYNSYAIHCLNALVGSIDAPGGVTYQQDPAYRPLQDIEKDDASNGYFLPRLDRCGTDSFLIGESAVNQIADSILEDNPYPVEIAIGLNSNLNMSAPGTWRWQAALAKIPYYVHVSPFLNETAEFADIVLPCPTFLETWAYDHSPPGSGFPELKIKQPVVNPVHDTRDIFDIVGSLAGEIGGSMASSFTGIGESARDFVTYRTSSIIPWEDLTQDGVWVGQDYQYRRYDRIFDTPSKKFEFYSGNLAARLKESGINRDSLTCLPHYEKSEFLGSNDEYPLLLSTYQPLPDIENGNQNYPWAQEVYMVMHGQGWTNFIEMNRRTAESLNIEDGHEVIVESSCGSLRGTARVIEGIMPGIISIAAGQGHYAGGRWADGMGVNPNDIICVDYDRLSGQSAFFNTRVRIRRV